MALFSKLFISRQNPASHVGEPDRKFNLLQTITLELLLFGIFFTAINIYLQFWVIAFILLIGSGIALSNLVLLRKNTNIILCGHLLNSLCLFIIITGNLYLGGISSTYFGWVYVPPLLAAATIGLQGLIFYGLLASITLILFTFYSNGAIYQISASYLPLIDNINHIFIFSLIVTILYNLLKENQYYETLLKEQNFLLNADKQKFHYLSCHDSLTNLPNRSYFNTYLQKIIDESHLTQNTITLYFMDLNGFKKINDKFGHEIGDILLLQIGKRLQTCFREKDFIARLGGDEFTALVINKSNNNSTDVIIKRIEQEFEKIFYIKNWELTCTMSIGTANFPNEASDAESLLNLADNRMYKNKKTKYKIKEQQ